MPRKIQRKRSPLTKTLSGSVFVTTDWKSVDAAAYALSASDAYGEEGNCLKIVAPENSGLVFGVSLNKAFDLKGYDKIYLRVKTNGAKTGYAFYTEHANVYTSRVIDLRARLFHARRMDVYRNSRGARQGLRHAYASCLSTTAGILPSKRVRNFMFLPCTPPISKKFPL